MYQLSLRVRQMFWGILGRTVILLNFLGLFKKEPRKSFCFQGSFTGICVEFPLFKWGEKVPCPS